MPSRVTVRFFPDEDLHGGLIEGLQSRESTIDILDVKSAGLRGMTDPALLELAAQQGRILITHDRGTMSRYFLERLYAGNGIASGRVTEPDRLSALPVSAVPGHLFRINNLYEQIRTFRPGLRSVTTLRRES